MNVTQELETRGACLSVTNIIAQHMTVMDMPMAVYNQYQLIPVVPVIVKQQVFVLLKVQILARKIVLHVRVGVAGGGSRKFIALGMDILMLIGGVSKVQKRMVRGVILVVMTMDGVLMDNLIQRVERTVLVIIQIEDAEH